MGEMIGGVHNEVKFFHSESTEGSCQRHSVLSMNRRHYLLRITVEIAGKPNFSFILVVILVDYLCCLASSRFLEL